MNIHTLILYNNYVFHLIRSLLMLRSVPIPKFATDSPTLSSAEELSTTYVKTPTVG